MAMRGELYEHVQRHGGRRGRPYLVQVPAPHRGSGHPGADRGHRHRPGWAPRYSACTVDATRAVYWRPLSVRPTSPASQSGSLAVQPEPLLTTAAHRASARSPPGPWRATSWPSVLIALLVVLILLMRSRRERARAAAAQGLGSGTLGSGPGGCTSTASRSPGPGRSPPGAAGSPGSLPPARLG